MIQFWLGLCGPEHLLRSGVFQKRGQSVGGGTPVGKC